LALYMIWVSLRGPLWARTLRMSIYISSFDLRMGTPLVMGLFWFILYISFTDLEYGFSVLFWLKGFCLDFLEDC